jgi:NitT/TauT family transport system permease protein
LKKCVCFLLGFVTLNLLWLAAALLLGTRALPGPFTVYAHFGEVFSSGIISHIGASLLRIATALLLAFACGVPIGLLMASSAHWGRLLHPLVYFSYPIPKTALLPVAMLLLGLGDGSKVLILSLTVLFQVIVAARDAAAGIDPGFYQVAISAGAPKSALLWQITLPAILPELFTSLRIGMGTSLAVLLLVEAYGTRAGVGYYILDAWSRIDYTEMYGGIIVISLTGAALFLAADLLFAKLCRWKS